MSSETTSDSKAESGAAVAGILVFHKFQAKFSFGSTNFSPRRFDKLLKNLAARNYSFDSIDGITAKPGKSRIAISFDDGYEHLRHILPGLIENYGARATVFIPTGYIGQENRWDYSYMFQTSRHLDESSIRELASTGVEFGSHGHSHQSLTRLSDDKLRTELETSRKKLEDITQQPVTKISYPFGRVNKRVLDAVAEAGYSHGFTMDFPVISDHPLARGRFAVYGFDTFFTIRQKISGGRLYAIEKMKASLANKLSAGTGIYRRLSGR